MSKKRILPALVLAGSLGMLGLHRFYAGRYITGLLQLVPFMAGAGLLYHALSDVLALQTVDQLQDWVFSHGDAVKPLPVLLVAIPSFWALVNCGLLAARRFRDGQGNKMTQWI